MALNSLYCADVPLSNYSLTHPAMAGDYIHNVDNRQHKQHFQTTRSRALTTIGRILLYVVILILTLSLSGLTVILPGEPGLADFIEAKDDESAGDNWNYKSCKAPVKSSTPNFLRAG